MKTPILKNMNAPKYLHITGKTGDLFRAELTNSHHQSLGQIDGYVPSNIGIGGGDYVTFTIDVETGQILNWQKPSQETFDKIFCVDGT